MFESSAWRRGAGGERRQVLRRLFLLRGPCLAVLAAGLALAWPTPGRADFVWLGDWNFTLVGLPVGPGSSAVPNFGSVTADLANAGGAAAAVTDSTMASSGTVTVTFMRQFQLINDPNDSDVTLFGTLSGALNSTSAAPGIAASAGVIANASIIAPGLPIVSAAASVTAINDTDNDFVLMPLADSAILADGIYTVMGELEVTASANQAQVGLADANANLNWIVGVSAVPLPEPPAFVQLSAGVSVLLAWLGWRRSRG